MDGEQGPRDPGWQECVLWGCGEDGTVCDSDLVPGSETGPPHHAKFRSVAHCVKAEVLLVPPLWVPQGVFTPTQVWWVRADARPGDVWGSCLLDKQGPTMKSQSGRSIT